MRWVAYFASVFVTLLAFDYAPEGLGLGTLIRGGALGLFGWVATICGEKI